MKYRYKQYNRSHNNNISQLLHTINANYTLKIKKGVICSISCHFCLDDIRTHLTCDAQKQVSKVVYNP